MDQILHHMLFLSVHFVIYVSAAEVGIMFILTVKCSDSDLQLCFDAICNGAQMAVSWAHEEGAPLPLFADGTSRGIIENSLPFWRTFNRYVKERGPFPPLKMFKNAFSQKQKVVWMVARRRERFFDHQYLPSRGSRKLCPRL